MTTDEHQPVVERAKRLLAGVAVEAVQALEVSSELARWQEFHLASTLLERAGPAVDPVLARQVAQKCALYTYKDTQRPDDQKLRDAWKVLDDADPVETSEDAETLGLAGAILKRRWELSGSKLTLERSLACYLRGHHCASRPGAPDDGGYAAINAAFVLDGLAEIEQEDPRSDINADGGMSRAARARGLRRALIGRFEPGDLGAADWWRIVTLGEAHFGCGEFDRARDLFSQAVARGGVDEWQLETTARQTAALLRMARSSASRGGTAVPQAADAALRALVPDGNAEAAIESITTGRVGLGLSGGGFRASLYHIGVLACLAEQDLLRHVEVVSCVSGGSIIGAHYYLEVKDLLEGKTDDEITREDYVELVRRLERDFVAGVQRNMRVRLVASWTDNLKMIFKSDHSRTVRLGQLYEHEIFSRVGNQGRTRKLDRWLDEMRIAPKLASGRGDEGFSPRRGNWRRRNKVPVLVLNSTALNTGHNWQFTATYMGESPARLNSEIDVNYRLRRAYYDELPAGHQKIRLGQAVAASACVPGLFDPLGLDGIYQRPTPSGTVAKPVVRLVDGGVHDNQGIAALLEQDCRVLVVSDASGQMGDVDLPPRDSIGVGLRANSILQARIRVAEYEDISSRHEGGLLNGMVYVHLKHDLGREDVGWQAPTSSGPSGAPRDDAPTSYGIQRGVQRRLAAIRTDLDSFSDLEAQSLMCSGYAVTQKALARDGTGLPAGAASTGDWSFLRAMPLMRAPTAGVLNQLDVAAKGFFKVWFLLPALRVTGQVIAIAALLALAWLAWQNRDATLLTVGGAALTAAAALLSVLGLSAAARWLGYRKAISEIALGLVLATFGWVAAWVHLRVFDRMFLGKGRIP